MIQHALDLRALFFASAGEVRVNKFVKGPSEGKYRILVREESSTQKLVLNSFLLPTMQVHSKAPNSHSLSLRFLLRSLRDLVFRV